MKTPFYIPMNVGDYLKDTTHLDTEGHGAYLLLMMNYWTRGYLPTDFKILLFITRMSSRKIHKLEKIMSEFFYCTEIEQHLLSANQSLETTKDVTENTKNVKVFKHKRLDIELEKANNKRDLAKKSAEKRWGNDMRTDMRSHNERISEMVCVGNANYNYNYNNTIQTQKKGECGVVESDKNQVSEPTIQPPVQYQDQDLESYQIICQIYFGKDDVSPHTIKTSKTIIDTFMEKTQRDIVEVSELVTRYSKMSLHRGFRKKSLKNFLSENNDFTWLTEQYDDEVLKTDEQKCHEEELSKFNEDEEIVKRAKERSLSKKNMTNEVVHRSSAY